MPIWDDEQDLPASQPQSIAQRVRAGAALPILSNAALFDLALFGYESFRSYYAEKIGYPFAQIPGPAQLANYDRYTNRASDGDCKAFYLACLKNHIYREARAAGVNADTLAEARAQVDAVGVTAFAHLLGYPRLDHPQTHPLLALANLPFKTYLTISPTTFLEDALRRAGKEPVSKMCRWRGPIDAPEIELWLIADDYWPSASRPLVYHLCGLDAHPPRAARRCPTPWR
jgi:hypothetical protein